MFKVQIQYQQGKVGRNPIVNQEKLQKMQQLGMF